MAREKVEDGHKLQGRWIIAPVADITTPTHGRICYGPSYWLVTGNDEVLFFDTYGSPQCNRNEFIARRGLGAEGPYAPPGARDTKFIEMAFLPHRCSDYV